MNKNIGQSVTTKEILEYLELAQKITNMEQDCTMEMGKLFMNVSKSPKLIELYEHLFKKKLDQKHRALDDAQACQQCFYKMLE